jgi:hypothetical protein
MLLKRIFVTPEISYDIDSEFGYDWKIHISCASHFDAFRSETFTTIKFLSALGDRM